MNMNLNANKSAPLLSSRRMPFKTPSKLLRLWVNLV